MLARAGLYARIWPDKDGRVHFFLLFKGNDLHSGTSPTVNSPELEEFWDILKKAYCMVGPENRCFYVTYPTEAAFERTTGVSMTQPTGFDQYDSRQHTFADEGFPACGSFDDWQTFMARERFMRAYNLSRMCRAQPSLDYPTFRNLDGELVVVEIPFDPELDAEYVDFMRGAFLQHDRNCSVYNLRMTKPMFALNQKEALAEAEARYIDWLSQPTPLPVNTSVSASTSSSTPTILVSTTKTVSQKKPTKKNKKGLSTSQPALRSTKTSAAEDRILDSDDSEGETWEISFILDNRKNNRVRISFLRL